MIDRIFFAALTFCLLIAGTLAIGSAMLGLDSRSVALKKTHSVAPQVVQLQDVVVVGRRALPATSLAQAHRAVDFERTE